MNIYIALLYSLVLSLAAIPLACRSLVDFLTSLLGVNLLDVTTTCRVHRVVWNNS